MGLKNFDFWNTENVLLWAVLAVIAVSFLMQLYYYLIIFRKVGLKQRKHTTEHTGEPVSIIVCVKDDSLNLSKILPLLLEQNYPEYEVVVVNDNSSDDSEEILKLAQNRYPHLQVRNLIANNSVHGKSVVLGVGIKAAKYNRVAVTDVACRPSTDWLKSVSTGFDSEIVMSYTRYIAAGKFVRIANYYESLFRLGYALNGRPYTASGENESFRKEIFFAKGFNPMLRKPEKVEQVFFNSAMNKTNTSVALLPEAIVASEKHLSFGNWCFECSLDLFSRRLFRKSARHVKLPEIISKTLFYVSCAAAIIMTISETCLWGSILGVFLLRLIIQIFVFASTQKQLGEKRLLLHTLIWDFYSVAVYLYVALLFGHRKAIRHQ
ncbi:MAG: glycosyltransferase [Prevotellaceae bacterium]|jgi:glycosyltransferase involved in cell wall biosynthesis|nr:glycosyltransferase [Prevotellaceae bacterium]